MSQDYKEKSISLTCYTFMKTMKMKQSNSNSQISEIINNSQIEIFPIDVVLIGATGAGKSSTLNALLGDTKAKIGNSFYPMTDKIKSYNFSDKLRFWDTPGVGDSYLSDINHNLSIEMLLRTEAISGGQWLGLIDEVLLIIDGSCKDLQSITKLLNEIVGKNISPNLVLVAINKIDQALDGNNWNKRQNCPNDKLSAYLDELSWQVEDRIYRSTGINIISPLCYSATEGYNIDKLSDYIISNIPKEKREFFKTSSLR